MATPIRWQKAVWSAERTHLQIWHDVAIYGLLQDVLNPVDYSKFNLVPYIIHFHVNVTLSQMNLRKELEI